MMADMMFYRDEVYVRRMWKVVFSAAESGDSRQHTPRRSETARMQHVPQEIHQ